MTVEALFLAGNGIQIQVNRPARFFTIACKRPLCEEHEVWS